jgi:putative hydrolase of the HAD superfamily
MAAMTGRPDGRHRSPRRLTAGVPRIAATCGGRARRAPLRAPATHKLCVERRRPGCYGAGMPIDLICLDADDTLWHNLRHFDAAERAFFALLAPFAAADAVNARLQKIQAHNLVLYGYGVKGFTLSLIETATDLCGDALTASAVRDILTIGRELHSHPVELLPGVSETLDALADRARLVLFTKGDLLHQETKVAASGLTDRFSAIEIVSDKTADAFRRLFARYDAVPDRCVMAGDSIRSDVLPALEAGAWAAHVPHENVWLHEHARAPADHPRFKRLTALSDLPVWIDALRSA